MGFNKSIPIEDGRSKIMKLPEGPRSPRGGRVGGLTRRMNQAKKLAPAQPKEINLTQNPEDNPFKPPINAVTPWKAGMKRTRGNNPPKQTKQARNRASGRGGRTAGNPTSIGRL